MNGLIQFWHDLFGEKADGLHGVFMGNSAYEKAKVHVIEVQPFHLAFKLLPYQLRGANNDGTQLSWGLHVGRCEHSKFQAATLAFRSYVKLSCQREPVVVHMIPNTKLHGGKPFTFSLLCIQTSRSQGSKLDPGTNY